MPPHPAGSEVTGDIGDLEPLTAIHNALNLGRYEAIIRSRFRSASLAG
jgi:hypothetical protein